VHHGDVDDRYGEFMIAVNETQSRADLVADFNTKYWAQRYTVRGEMVPIFLQRAAEKILTTGKYLNVLRGCGAAGEARLKASRRRMIDSFSAVHAANASSSTNSASSTGNEGSYDFGGDKTKDASGTLLDDVVAAQGGNLQETATVGEEQQVLSVPALSASSSSAQPLRYEAGERANIDAIERASQFASKALLDLLLTDNQLLLRLRSLKHYFLVDQGDFFVHFMDAAEEELRRSTSDISHARLEFLLDTSIRQSISDGDAFNSNLKCTLLPYTLIQHLELVQQLSGEDSASGALSSSRVQGMDSIEDTRRKLLLVRHNQQLKGMEAFALDYEVKWPLSIVVSRKELTKYQLVFRHLFFCNHVKRQVRYALLLRLLPACLGFCASLFGML
jgi:gamma-tubulin complex component 2